MSAGDSVTSSSDNGLNQSLSTIVCLAYEHPSPAWRSNIPFCVADVDHDEDTTYQLIGFGETCKQEGYKIQGYLTSQNADKFLAVHKAEINNAQFRKVDLISCAALGIEDNRRTEWLNTYIPLGGGSIAAGVLYCFSSAKKFKSIINVEGFSLAKRLKDAAVVTGLLGAAGTIFWFLLELHAEHLKEEQRYKRIQDLLSGTATAEKK
ncbi:MAG: hypothetical protein HYY43_06820 [Deltaproteobacteria bacterium]|nr:hypothetical protein [Deltaproteobacteria bacterium]MBI2341493.1 hypothetical protein [Deltaproteobacteria bacterium]MBI2975283.1 hypothetical protein [Deltaproteobacteria bacterium]